MRFDYITSPPPLILFLCGSFCMSLVVGDLWNLPEKVGSTLVGSSLFFINVCSADSCNFGVLMRGGELRVFLLLHLGLSPNYYIF